MFTLWGRAFANCARVCLSMRVSICVHVLSSLKSLSMAAAGKREYDVSGLNEEAVVHGRVLVVSPIKCSRKNDKMKYFDCSLTDGNDTCRLVSFDPHIRPELEDCMEKGQSVSLSNCEIKRAKGGKGLEIVLSEKSRVTHSPKKFKVNDEMRKKASGVTELEKMEKMKDIVPNVGGNKVSIKGKIVGLKESEKIKSKERVLVKREIEISDESQACRLVLWEELVGSVEEGKSYRICNVCVKAYGGMKYFSSTDTSTVDEITDIGEVCVKSISKNEVFIGEIIGIVSSSHFSSCVSCGGKVWWNNAQNVH